MDTFEALTTLRTRLASLTPRDQATASSLVEQYDRRQFLTQAQENFCVVLAQRALNGGVTPRTRTSIGGLGAINALFDRAAARLKVPMIVIGHAGVGYRLRRAGVKARVPGSIDVLSVHQLGGRYDWFGRILASGEFEASPRAPTPPALVPALQAFAADPAKAAGAYGKATGRCCFCNLPIGEGDDPRARAVGYGEVCAGHYGLPFPAKAQAIAANAALMTGAQLVATTPAPVNVAPAPYRVMVTPEPQWTLQHGVKPEPGAELASILNAGPPGASRPAGVCRACFAKGEAWDEPMFDGSCYACGGVI